jgi:hypothetical protein
MEIIEENAIVRKSSGVISKIDLLMTSLSKFYLDEKNINILIPIVNGLSKISLRVLDWFVTNFCKKHNTVIHYHRDGKPNKLIVHLDYKNQLKAYSKKQFDPFCRRERINFIYGKGNELLTTVGQLNFFRWAIEYYVIDYIIENLEIIEADMNNSLKIEVSGGKIIEDSLHDIHDTQDTQETQEKKRKKRHELSISASKSVSKHNVKITVEFS